MTDTSNQCIYTREFQINLLVHLYKDIEFFRSTNIYIKGSDFDLAACQLIYECLQHYYNEFNKLPDFQTLQLLVIKRYEAQLITNSVTMPKEQIDSILVYVFKKLHSTTTLNTEFYRKELNSYLRAIRMKKALAEFSIASGKPDHLIEQAIQINKEISNNSDLQFDSILENPEPVLNYIQSSRISTSIRRLDILTNGGLGAAELGMVVAATGIGKSNALINFMLSAVNNGHRCLFFTLELPAITIKRRFQAMAAHIPIYWFDHPVETWPKVEQFKYSVLLNKDINKRFGFESLISAADVRRRLTVDDIEISIQRWKDRTDKVYGKADECRVVCIDWLDYLDCSGLNIRSNDRDDKILTTIVEKLGNIARRQNVGIWTATQATRDAVGKELMSMKYTAQAFHKNDALDLSLGLAPQNTDESFKIATDSELVMDKALDSNNWRKINKCDQNLVTTIMKNRRGKRGQPFTIYQGETLRFWNTRSDYEEIKMQIDKGNITEAICGYRTNTN